ncbi:hypothetical protein SDC9_61742 [bioreactor metagenome]|uniref:N-acetyltransferase domain-containing protein n=1 Tax=bioreactor metagenome TaxID=1076179 RepID=A0A644XM92_9ZZZZ
MEIRLAEHGDILKISKLYEEFFVYNASQQPLYYKPAAEMGKYPQSVIESAKEALFIAEENGAVLGLIHIIEEQTPPYDCFVPHRYATIMDLYVTEDFRGRGIGRELMEYAKRWAKTRGLHYLELSVLAENEDGIRFYRRENFQTVSQVMRAEL